MDTTKKKKTLQESLSSLNDQLVLAESEGNTRTAKIIRVIIRRMEQMEYESVHGPTLKKRKDEKRKEREEAELYNL